MSGGVPTLRFSAHHIVGSLGSVRELLKEAEHEPTASCDIKSGLTYEKFGS